MASIVNIGDADLDKLLEKVEAGEDVVLARDGVPVAQLKRLVRDADSKADLIETILRERAARKPVTQEEIAEWKQIGRR
jgi:antitoxin (DNA-binding transcriptional repressor) of toxin-antitoxin stability system